MRDVAAGDFAIGRSPAIFRLILTVPSLVVIIRWLWPLSLPWWSTAIIATLMLVASQYLFWSRLSSGSSFAPEFPRFIVILFNWAFGAIALLAVLQIALDIGAVIAMAARQQVLGAPNSLRYAIAGVAGLLTAYGLAGALRVPPVKDIEVAIRGLPAAFDGYRLLQMTDLHISRLFTETWAKATVERANASGVDLIVVTGDFIDGSVDMRRADVEPLRDLHAPDGVYGIPGNHEYFFDYAAWMRHLSAMGIVMLANAHAVITRGQDRIVVAGVTDPSARGHGEAGPDIGAALANAPDDAPVILLAHQPRYAKQAAARGVALQLSGHTHGGMIGLDRLVANANGGFVSGRYQVEGMTLYVSNGSALWPGFAIRLGRPSELTRITLRQLP